MECGRSVVHFLLTAGMMIATVIPSAKRTKDSGVVELRVRSAGIKSSNRR